MKSDKFNEVCTKVTLGGIAATWACFGVGAVMTLGSLVKEYIRSKRIAKKHEKQLAKMEEAAKNDDWETFKKELDEMIGDNKELLEKTEEEIAGKA